MTTATEYRIRLRRLHPHQEAVRLSPAKRKIIRAGRRGGKTVGAADIAVERFLAGRRILYGSPTTEQVDAFWFEVKRALQEPLDAGIFYKNETEHIIERPGMLNRIRAKTCWNADSLRGDYGDDLILDEWQLMNEDTWERVGAPMLLDNNGDAMFIYTPPSLHSRSVSKARDPRHAAKMFKMAQADTTGRWAAFHWRSLDNPYISQVALRDIVHDMTAIAIRQEIMAEDLDEAPGALWTMKLLEATRVAVPPDLARIVVGVDPPGGKAECGIITAGLGGDGHLYVLEDRSLQASPQTWAEAVLDAYSHNRADMVVAELNFGGDMVESTVMGAARAVRQQVRFKAVHASRGKAVRAEPIVAAFEQGRAHLVGSFPALEDELTMWVPGQGASPSRLDSCVWALTELSSRGYLRDMRPLTGKYGRDQGLIERVGW